MKDIHNRIYLNRMDVPARNDGETEEHFEQRMESYRRDDLRVPVAGRGKPNFGFDRYYNPGVGVSNISDSVPRSRMEYGRETGEVFYTGHAGGAFSLV